MYELGLRPKLRFWAKKSMKQTRKIVIQEIQLLSSRTPYKWKKKTYQSSELLHYDIRARIYSQLTILGQDEEETDAKNQT